MDRSYPTNPAFEAALKQARERAAGFNRARQQAHAPDPPDSSDGNGSKKAKDRKIGSGAAASPGQPNASRAPSAAAAAASQHPGQMDVASAAAAMAAERSAAAVAAERSAAAGATAMYHHLPLHGRLGMGAGPGAGSLLHQLQITDLHNRIAFEQRQQERVALLAAARPPWAPGSSPHMAAAAAAEDRWRATQGLPPIGASAYLAGRGLHPGAPPLGARGPLGGPHLPPLAAGSDGVPPELRAAEYERAAAMGLLPGEAEVNETKAAPANGGASSIDLLAAAAEDTLRREERVKRRNSADPDGKAISDPPATTRDPAKAVTVPSKSAKRKRKGANEPKNPLGAFVFYQRKIMADVFEENPCITFGEAAAECGRRWRLLSAEDKEEFRQMAADDKARYTRELAHFRNKGEGDVETVVPVIKPKATTPRRKKQDDGTGKSRPEPKRPKSALLFFKAAEIPKVLKEYPNVTQKEAATEAAARYKTLTKAGKEKYETMAAQDKERYQRELKEKGESEKASMPAQRTRSGRGVSAPPPENPKVAVVVQKRDDEKTAKDINSWSPAKVQVPSQVAYEEMKDPNSFYVEETAWRYHNPPVPLAPTRAAQQPEKIDVKHFPYVSHEELRPLPRPPPLPTAFPSTPFCRWSYDEDTRVLHADFRRPSGDVFVTLEDERFLLEMYERDDITVVSEGLVSGLNKEKWTLDYVSRVAGDEYYHRFRRFDKQAPGSAAAAAKPKKKASKKPKPDATTTENENEDISEKFVGVEHAEIDKMLSMKVKDFVEYLRRRGAALATLKDITSEEDKLALRSFAFLDHTGAEHKIDVIESALYMLDYDMVKLLPTLYEDFVASFKLRGVLPGGSHCMMNCVNSNGRPFMGPNMYITPPGSFTHFHQDGHGTVDSGHFCMSGFNEVVMTRRLTERSKRHALRLLTGGYKETKGHSFEGLYDLPHADNLGEKPQWPDNEAIDKCNEMNYCISRFILKEGQCVHINKGRLHAFRKVSNEPLPANDCHAKLRADLMIPGTNERVVGPEKPEILCISVAWDWMYRGVTAKGINREIVSILECAALNRKYGALSLAIPELSLIQMARTLAPKPDESAAPPGAGAYKETLVGFDSSAENKFGINTDGYIPNATTICKGIFPALQYVVKQHIYAINVAESLKSKSFERNKRVSVAARPNAWENPVTHPLDPYGNSDFFCKLCNKELSNVYLHCDGCELLLSKDFNICLECHQEKRYVASIQMHPLNNKRHSTINHIGNFTFDRASRCPCKNGPVCRHCSLCSGCSCRCHSWFTLYFRFFKKDDELKLLHRVKLLVGREELDAAAEAEKRLSMAIKGRYSEEGDAGPFGLHNMDVIVESQFADAVDEEITEVPEEGALSAGNGGEKDAAPVQPKRKSRRLSTDPADTDARMMEATADVDDTNKSKVASSHIDRTNKDIMQMEVQDMKVTIRYKSGEWEADEVMTLKQALENPENTDWTSIVAKFPERGSDQVRNVARSKFLDLVETLKKRASDLAGGTEAVRVTNTDQAGQVKMDEEDQKDGGSAGAREDKASTPVDEVEVKAEATGKADAESPTANVPEKEEEEVKEEVTDEKKSESVLKLPPANKGHWNDDEKERLRVALQKCPDLEAVEQYVGTRRVAAIRSFAPRTFPELYQELRDRAQMSPGAKKGTRRSSKIERTDPTPKEVKPDPDGALVDSARPATRRSSRRGSRRNSELEEKVQGGGKETEEREETNSHEAGETTEDESMGENYETPSSPGKSPGGSKLSVINRSRSGRGRRSTQDLSGGRKRRNSGFAAAKPAEPTGDSDSTEEEPSPTRTAAARKKRAKVEE